MQPPIKKSQLSAKNAPISGFEERLAQDSRWALSEGSKFFEGAGAVKDTLRKVTKKLDELIDRGVDSTPVVNASGPAAASASSTPAAPQVVGRPEPGVKLSEGINSCQTNDPAPAGTVVNGMRKVIRQTPFGNSCFWEAVK